ncbi:shikimate kinase [Alphaproteobacteria bacterium]|nr:shikimate kinase [Alphaproteobacteria bacterium]
MENHSENFATAMRPASPLVSFMPPKPVVLVGLMGCGKTSIGKRLAKRLDLPFCDSDQEVEVAAGCSVQDIESFFGEGALQSGEYKVLDRLLNQQTQVIATGCLSFTYPTTMELIKKNSISVWLDASLSILSVRLSGRKERVLFHNGQVVDFDDEAVLKSMIDTYNPMFQNADVVVQTQDESANITVDRVIIAISEFIKTTYPDYHVLKSV